MELADITVVIPAWNEEQSLPLVLRDLPPVGLVIVVDNGSRDSTVAVARAGGAHCVTELRRGYGSACLRGLWEIAASIAAGNSPPEIVVFLDADYSDHPDELPLLVAPIRANEADIVIGSRALGQREAGSMPPQSRYGNWLACSLMALIWGAKFTDLGPFRAIRYNDLLRLGMQDQNFGWTIEMQIKAVRHGLRIREIPVSYRRRIGVSKISGTLSGTIRAGAKILWTIARYSVLGRSHHSGQPASAELDTKLSVERFPTTATASTTSARADVGPGMSHIRLSENLLIVLTRYPVAGYCKTRLIPAIGVTAATALSSSLTAWTLRQAEQFRNEQGASVEIHYTGSSQSEMASMFGVEWNYYPQDSGDLGQRLAAAFQHGFRQGYRRIAIIGTDCPKLDASTLESAFVILENAPVVCGPTSDGGYYLIGLTELEPKLFENIAWGSNRVLAETLAAAAECSLAVQLLPELPDIDVADDLHTLPAELSAVVERSRG